MTLQSSHLRNSRSDLTVARQHAASGRFGDFLALCRQVAEFNNRGQTTVFLKTPVLLTRGRVFSISALRMCRVFTEDSTLRAGCGDGGDECAAGGVSSLARERLREVVEVVVVTRVD